ncbi:MAG: hypothetical protein K0Q94_4784 [Paenibacillus sp.]|uniref:Ger(x)C family spore germination protein n=1 Tax=Paenibacillus sp. GCM10012303 TaxID=3317340 RepID=UPI0029EDA555|nr:hypothetical protein [Paenibacillus sp.]
MKSRSFAAVASLMVLILTTGCWDNEELTGYGFVQAVAIDLTKDGEFQLTTHFYSPTGGAEMRDSEQQKQSGINIQTQGKTIFEAVRDIPIHFGRKAKWDHLRVILLGEQVLRTQGVGAILEYFSRDHEPRGTILPLVTEGPASDYLNIKPFIEHTIGQQLKRMETDGADYAAKTSKIPLFELAIQLKSATGVSTVPYIHRDGGQQDVTVSGIALLKDGKLAKAIVTPKDTQALMLLTNKYKSGILEYPCSGGEGEQPSGSESFEVLDAATRLTPRVENDQVTVRIQTRIAGAVGELRCTQITKNAEKESLEDRLKRQVERQIRKTLSFLQRERMDALGIGNQVYRKEPALWKQWQPVWGEHFAKIRFHLDVDVQVLNTGMNVGKPFGREDE